MQKKISFNTLLVILIVATVTAVMTLHMGYTYFTKKQQIIEKMRSDATLSISYLQKNIAHLIEAYAVNEYEKILLTEMELRGHFALIVEDYNMAKIVGKNTFITGYMKDSDEKIVPFESVSLEYIEKLEDCYYKKDSHIYNSSKNIIGKVKVYISDSCMKQELEKIVFDSFIKTFGIAIVLIFFLIAVLRFFMLKPLEELAKNAKQCNQEGIPIADFSTLGYKEVAILGEKLNDMISLIKNTQQDLMLRNEQLQYSAKYDHLTKLPNRYLFYELMQKALYRCKRKKCKVAVLFLDLDGFKLINDTYGHEAGDYVLQEVSLRMKELIREDDIVARLGGDEFIIGISEFEKYSDVTILAVRLLQKIPETIIYKNAKEHLIHITMSIGISFQDENNYLSLEDLVAQADKAMYDAKHKGKNRYKVYSLS